MAITRLTDDLKPGMTLEQDIYNKNNVLLLARGSTLTEETIQSIKKLGYTKISVQKTVSEPEFWNHLDKEKIEGFKKSYEDSGQKAVELIGQISRGQEVDVLQVYQIPGAILREARSPYNLISYLSHINQLDHHTHGHSINVSLICNAICRWLELEEDVSRDVVVAGLLHDVGKSRLNPDLLYKNQLNLKEQEDFKNHTTLGFRMLEEANAPENVRLAALYHHEREDGSGYPTGLTGDRIPLAAKITAIADVFDTLTSNQNRRDKICPFKAINNLQVNYFGLLDTKILYTFLARIAECYVGEMVRLSDGRVGQIVVTNRTSPAMPMVRTEADEIINLAETPELSIEAILPAGEK